MVSEGDVRHTTTNPSANRVNTFDSLGLRCSGPLGVDLE